MQPSGVSSELDLDELTFLGGANRNQPWLGVPFLMERHCSDPD